MSASQSTLGYARRVAKRIMFSLASPEIAYFIGEPFFRFLGMRRKGKNFDLSQVNRVLVVRLDEIGDVIMTTPFLRELRYLLPHAHITLIVKPALFNLVELCPYVNEIRIHDWNIKGRFGCLRRHWRALALAYKHMWHLRFDLAIIPRWDIDYYHAGFLAYYSGATWRIGYSESVNEQKSWANKSNDRLYTHILQDKTIKHEVEHNLDVIRFLGGTVKDNRLELWVGEEDESLALNVLIENEVRPGEYIVGFGPSGGDSPLKQWPVDNFITLGRWLRDEWGCRVIIFGGSGEVELGERIEHGIGSSMINMVGKTTLRQAAALMKKCVLYVGNDAGPMHMAAAMGIPVIALFISSCHHRFGPWTEKAKVLSPEISCKPCNLSDHPDRCFRCIFDQPRCVFENTVEQVKEAVREELSRQRGPDIHE